MLLIAATIEVVELTSQLNYTTLSSKATPGTQTMGPQPAKWTTLLSKPIEPWVSMTFVRTVMLNMASGPADLRKVTIAISKHISVDLTP